MPEVQTTVDGLNKTVKGLEVVGVSTEYNSPSHLGRDNIKDPKFFAYFRKKVKGQKILKAERRAKNILIHLSNGFTILVHMKMTGHFFYNFPKETKYLRLIFHLSNGKSLGFSDLRKFAKVTLIETNKLKESLHISHLGPEPLSLDFTFPVLESRLSKRPRAKIKTALMDQTLVSGVGNIYADETLWLAGVHPLSIVEKIPEERLKLIFKGMKQVLRKGIDFGGDSTSDYRNIHGEKGQFQGKHNAYRKTKTKCQKRGCLGIIERIMVGPRSAHFCPKHQRLYK